MLHACVLFKAVMTLIIILHRDSQTKGDYSVMVIIVHGE